MHLPGGVFFPFSRSAWFLPIARTTLCAMFDSQFTPNQQSVVTIMDSHKAAKAVKPKRNMSLGLVSLLFLAPALVFYIAFELWPIIQTIWYSFYEWNGIDASTFIGVENYITVFTDPDLYGSILHSFYLIIFFSIIPIVLGLIIAVLIKDMKSKVGRSFAQVCLFLPRVIPGAAAGVAWTWMLADKGTANQLLRAVGLGDFAHVWLGDQSTSLNAVGVIGFWLQLGFCVVLLLSGIGGIDQSLYEAASLDGAGWWRQLFSITLPGLRGQIGVCLTMTIISALASFDVVYMSTQGGPGTSTMVPGVQVYRLAFTQQSVGLASALAVTLMILVLLVVGPLQRLTVLFCVLPFLSMLSAALQPQGSMPEGIQFTAHPHWENFIDAWNMANITPLLLNSCILVIVVVPCVVIFCSLGGYAFAQLKVPCKGLIYVLFLVGLTIPFETLVTPLYYEISGMGLLNTRLALILPLIGLNIPFGIVWMRSCFEQMPRDLIEAASIDGAGHLRTFRSIQLPLALPAISSLGILTFLATWNQFLLAVVLENDPNKRTMAGALQSFVGQYQTDVVLLNAGALLIMAPTMILFIFLQRYFIRAMLAGSVKG